MIFLIVVDVNWQNFSLYLLIKVFLFLFLPFNLIHSDVWRPSPVAIKGESWYYVSFIDDHILGFSPFEKLYGYVPDYSSFRVFGCTCFVLCPMQNAINCPLDLLFDSFLVTVKVKKGIVVLIQQLRNFMYLIMLFFSSIYLSFLFHLLLIAWLDLILFV